MINECTSGPLGPLMLRRTPFSTAPNTAIPQGQKHWVFGAANVACPHVRDVLCFLAQITFSFAVVHLFAHALLEKANKNLDSMRLGKNWTWKDNEQK